MWLQVTEITSHLVELKRGPNVSLPPHIQTSLYYPKAFSWEDLKLPFMTSPEQVFQFNKSSLSSFSSLSRLFFVLSRKTYIGLFADDSTYFRTISDPSDFSILLKDLDSLHGVRHTFDCFGSPDILFHFVCPLPSAFPNWRGKPRSWVTVERPWRNPSCYELRFERCTVVYWNWNCSITLETIHNKKNMTIVFYFFTMLWF